MSHDWCGICNERFQDGGPCTQKGRCAEHSNSPDNEPLFGLAKSTWILLPPEERANGHRLAREFEAAYRKLFQ